MTTRPDGSFGRGSSDTADERWWVYVSMALAVMALATFLVARNWPGMEAGDRMEVWRWSGWLLVGSVAVLVFERTARMAWLDLLTGGLAVLVLVAAAATVWGTLERLRRPAEEPAAVKTAAVVIPGDAVQPPVRPVTVNGSVKLVVVVEAMDSDGKVVTREGHSYEATLPTGLSQRPGPGSTLEVALERGEKDANLLSFLQHVSGAKAIYAVPPA